MNRICLFALTAVIIACSPEKKEKEFDAFVYSYAAENINYSVKFTDGDTIYFRRRYPNPQADYYALFQGAQKDSLLALAGRINFANYDSIYKDETLSDGVAISFYRKKDNKADRIFVHDMQAPPALFKLAERFNKLAGRFDFKPTPAGQDYGNVEGIALPAPPAVENREK